MQNTNFTKFENELISYFIGMCHEIDKIITPQFESAKNIKRDFTGMGSFISFEVDQSKSFSLENTKFSALDGPDIHSTELENGAYSIFFFNKMGVFDCIEIVGKYGNFPEKELQNYIFSDPGPINVIKSNE